MLLGILRYIYIALLALCICCLLFSPAFSAEEEPKRILVLNSYFLDYQWTEELMSGVENIFSAAEEDYFLHVEYMDTKRYHDPYYLNVILEQSLQHKLGNKRYDLLLVSDNDAFNFVTRHQGDLFKGMPLVFCGVNHFQPEMISEVDNVTGVAELSSIPETINLALDLHSEAKQIISINNTRNSTDRLLRKRLISFAPILENRVELINWDNLNLGELTARLQQLGPGQIVLLNSSVIYSDEGVLPFNEGVAKLRQVSGAPIYGHWSFALDKGIVGGKLVSAEKQGRLAAQLAIRILNGEEPSSIPVITDDSNEYMFDYNELFRFGIALNSLPEGSVIINMPEPFYHVNKTILWTVLGITIGLALFSVALLRNIASRKRTEKELLYRENFENLISRISTRFVELPPAETDRGIDQALKDLGEFVDADRCYVFIFRHNSVHIDNTHEWCAEQVVPQIGNLQNVLVGDLPWAMAKILNKQVLHVPSVKDLPPEAALEKEHWEEQHVQALVAVPIIVTGEIVGFLGFDEVHMEKQWGEKDITLLQTVGNLIGNALEHQRSEKIQKESERRLSTLMSNLPGMAYRCLNDQHWTMEFVSDGCQSLTGFKSESLIGNKVIPYAEIIHPDDLDQVWQQVQDALWNKHPFQMEYRIRTACGEERWVWEQGIGVFDDKGELVALEGFISDIDERRKAVETLQQSDRMKTEFVKTVAHEFRTPLTAIQGFSELLLTNNQLTRDEQEQSLRYVYERSFLLADLVDDMLDIARIESGAPLSMNMSPCTVKDIFQQVEPYLNTQKQKASLDIRLNKEDTLLNVDKGRMVQVLENLLSNAIKFSGGDSAVLIEGELVGKEYQFSVADRGIGMSPDQKEKIFEKFYRADASDTAAAGVGLGMSIVKHIIEAHGGKIWVESELDRGTTISFTVPLIQENAS